MRRITALVCTAIMAATFLWGGLSSRSDVPEYATASARGTIEDVWNTADAYHEEDLRCSTRVRFDAQRRRWRVTGPPDGSTSAACHLEPGQTLEVRYDPENPRAAVVAHDLDAEFAPIGITIGLVFLALTVLGIPVALLFGRRPRAAPVTPVVKRQRARNSRKRKRKRRKR